MKEKTLKINILVYLTIIIITIFFFKNVDIQAYESNNSEDVLYEENYRYQPTMDDNFDDDKIIVTIKEKYSAVNKVFNLEDFVSEKLIINANQFEEINLNSEYVILESLEDLTHIDNSNAIKDIDKFSQIFSLKIKNKSKENVLKAIKYLSALDFVQCAEPSYIYETVDLWTPDDSIYSSQWGLNYIDIVNAWNFSIGNLNSRIKVGIFERNLESNHEDLNVVSGSFIPNSSASSDHGTHVAGIIGAISDNSIGIAGIAQVDIALLDRQNFITSIHLAINNDIRIINASFYYGYVDSLGNKVLSPPNESYAEAIENFGKAGGLFVTSAGNSGNSALGNLDDTPQYPGGYGDSRRYPSITNVITVGALNQNGERLSSSNYGANSVHIYAPGESIISTLPGNSYGNKSGTSMAAPHVAGVAALMLSINPNISAEELRNAILNNSETISIHIPSTAGGTTFVKQNVRSLNAFMAVASIAFDTSSNDNGIILEGIVENFNFFDGTHLILPDSFTQYEKMLGSTRQNVIGIGTSCFENNNVIENITLPAKISTISSYSFKNCEKIVELNIPSGVLNIETAAFEGCENLESITLPSSLTSIGSNAFKGCSSLTELVIPNSVTTMGNSILSDCFDIAELTIPYLNTYMGELFGLDNYLGHSNPKIQLKTLTINGGGIIPEYAFYNFYSLENIYLPNTITSIGSKAFYNGNIGSIELPESLVSIGDYAFYDCNKLTNIVIPNSVETIGNNAFEWCDELTTVEIQKDTTPITSIGVNVFNNCSELENIIVPMSKILKYKNANNWSNYSNKISYDDVAEGMYVMYVNCYSDISEDEELQSRKSIVYELNVDCVKEYNIICSTTEELVVYLYDSNMELSGIYPTYSNSNHTATFITELPLGVYYLEISYSDYQKSGSISTTISPSNGSIHYTKTTGMTSILPHLHKVSSNTYKAQFSFVPTYKTGLHKLSLSGTTSSGSNIVFGSGSISVYDNLSKITPMYQYSMLGLDNLAVSGGKEILVYLEKNETYYIDVTLSSNQYSALNLQILTYYNCEIGAADLPPYDISIMSNNKSYGSDLCEFILHDAMDFTVTIEGLTEGKFIIYQEVISEEGIISYSLVKEESFTGDFTDSFSLEAGSYYIGYIDASTSDDMNYDIMRIVVD